ncbi:MAG: DUF3343 domain-containing protein [Papillibacter sp.]|nr:DUF3343 domain-containing protein [Papillibacter sp.]
MKYYYLVFRSLTYAQKGSRALNRAGLSSTITRPPSEINSEGCAYSLKVSETRKNAALNALSKAGISVEKILEG